MLVELALYHTAVYLYVLYCIFQFNTGVFDNKKIENIHLSLRHKQANLLVCVDGLMGRSVLAYP